MVEKKRFDGSDAKGATGMLRALRVTRSEVVQVIGTKFVLYRPSHRKDKKDKIVLVEDKKKRGV